MMRSRQFQMKSQVPRLILVMSQLTTLAMEETGDTPSPLSFASAMPSPSRKSPPVKSP